MVRMLGKSQIHSKLSKSRSVPEQFRLLAARSRRESAQTVDPTAMNSLLGFRAFREVGLPAPNSKPVVVRFNDRDPGLYVMIENVDGSFFRRRDLGIQTLYKARNNAGSLGLNTLTDPGYGYGERYGDLGWEDLKGLIQIANSRPLSMEKMRDFVDIDQMIVYLSVHQIIGHIDGIVNNHYLAKLDKYLYGDRTDTGTFWMIPWDLDRLTFQQTSLEKETFAGNKLMSVLTDQEETQQKWSACLTLFSGTHLSPAVFSEWIDGYVASMAEAYEKDPVYKHSKGLSAWGDLIKDRVKNSNSVLNKNISTLTYRTAAECPILAL